MLFNSWTFFVFLIVVLTVYYRLPLRGQNALLLVASYVFYGFWDWRFTGLLALSTLVDYTIGRTMGASEDPKRRRALLIASVCVNLGILGFFKYYNFFVESAVTLLDQAGVNPNVTLLSVILPVGISFYTFQTMAYTIDVYRKRQEAVTDLLAYGVYVAYFPQLVAGPIERAQRLLPQIQKTREVTRDRFHSGVQLILWGMVKKVAIADSLAKYVDQAFEAPGELSAVHLWLGIYCFALQIYADFSGYTDIARGVSRLFGIELIVNFKQPYFSRNITEFWRRWHISLSSWLRDYLYIPLGGNRSGSAKQYRNLMLTMLIGGLWHGAAWTFVVWGGLHGLYLAVHRMVSGGRRVEAEPPPTSAGSWLRFALGVLVTFHLVCIAWVFFRAQDFATAWTYLQGLFVSAAPLDFAELVRIGLIDSIVFYGILFFLLDCACWFKDRELPLLEEHHWAFRGVVYAVGLFILAFIREGGSEPFIYFQF